MTASRRAELVDEVMNAILAFYRDRFPVMHSLEVQAVAVACEHPYRDNMQDGRNKPENDDAFGESFHRLVTTSAAWLAREGWLTGEMGTSGPYYTLSERGARLAHCLPATLDVD